MKKSFSALLFLCFCFNIVMAQEEKRQYGGIVYNTIINDDRVNVRRYPSLEGTILFQLNRNDTVTVTGVSKDKMFIDNYNGYWVKIIVRENRNSLRGEGWVFSKYVNGNINPVEIKISGLEPERAGYGRRLNGSYMKDGKEILFSVYPHKESNQNYYTFVWDIYNEKYYYNSIFGSYVWYPDTNELRHITYIGESSESAWVVFTDDFKYIIEDFGTGPAPRGLGVWRLSDEKRVFSGSYYGGINRRGNTIEVIYRYDWWNIENNRLDAEILKYGENFKKQNPEPQDMVQDSRESGLGIDLIIVCELNLDTNSRRIIKGQYIHTQ